MRLGLALAAVVALAFGCVHDVRPYAFAVQAPPSATYVAAQNALRQQGQVVIPESSTRLVTPWQAVGETTVVTSVRSGILEPIIIWRRYAILVEANGAGTTVTVSQERKTCPPEAPEAIPGTPYSPCVRQFSITPDEQQTLDRLGRDLQRNFSGAAR